MRYFPRPFAWRGAARRAAATPATAADAALAPVRCLIDAKDGVTTHPRQLPRSAVTPFCVFSSFLSVDEASLWELLPPNSAARQGHRSENRCSRQEAVEAHLPGHFLSTPPYHVLPHPLRNPKRRQVYGFGVGQKLIRVKDALRAVNSVGKTKRNRRFGKPFATRDNVANLRIGRYHTLLRLGISK